jgi:hypothetical protein
MCRILDFHSGVAEGSVFVGCDAVSLSCSSLCVEGTMVF